MIIKGFEDLKEQPKMETKPKLPWSDTVMAKVGARSAASESPVKLWYTEEDAKRRARQKNEIDIAEIRQAAKGGKNRWSERLKKNLDLYKPVLAGKDCDWEALLNGKRF